MENLLSIIESKFHGKSSGLDPLVSFYSKPILLSNQKIKLLDDIDYRDYRIYLINSNINASTKEMIEMFNMKMKDTDFNAFFNNDGSLSRDIYTLDRTYPMKVSGRIINYSFSNNTQIFNLQYVPNNSSLPSVIYLNYNRRYNNGVNINITPNKIASYQIISNNRLLIIHNLHYINSKAKDINSKAKDINIT